MIRDQPPEAPSVRTIRRALGHQQARAGETGNTRAHRADHPAHVTEEEKRSDDLKSAQMIMSRVTIEPMKLICVQTQPFGSPVVPEVYSRIAGSSAFISAVASRASPCLATIVVPPVIAALLHRGLDPKRLRDRRRSRAALLGEDSSADVEDGFERPLRAAPPGPVRGDDRLRLAMVEPRLASEPEPKPREQRHQDRADLQHREERDKAFPARSACRGRPHPLLLIPEIRSTRDASRPIAWSISRYESRRCSRLSSPSQTRNV